MVQQCYGQLNPLSQEEGGGGLLQPPFQIFPRNIFAFLLRLPYGQFTHPMSRYPYIYEKNFSKLFAVKNVGGWEGMAPKNGVAPKINKFS